MNTAAKTERTEVTQSEYTTHRVGRVREDGSWTAELRKDGVAYGQVDVGSISALIDSLK